MRIYMDVRVDYIALRGGGSPAMGITLAVACMIRLRLRCAHLARPRMVRGEHRMADGQARRIPIPSKPSLRPGQRLGREGSRPETDVYGCIACFFRGRLRLRGPALGPPEHASHRRSIRTMTLRVVVKRQMEARRDAMGGPISRTPPILLRPGGCGRGSFHNTGRCPGCRAHENLPEP